MFRVPARKRNGGKSMKSFWKSFWKAVGIFYLVCIGPALALALVEAYYPVLIVLAALFLAWLIYKFAYFRGSSFSEIKERISAHIADCNALNQHIEELKDGGLVDNRLDLGVASYQDTSKWKMKRSKLDGGKYAPFKYDCSRQICDNARKEPFKYICKYFNIKTDEESLSKFESILNNFEAAEDGKEALKAERESILSGIQHDVPFLIRTFAKKDLEKNLGFEAVDFTTVYFPHYIFRYTSSGGNASTQCDIVMDIENLNKFVAYLADRVKFRKSAAGQRALMTSRLRQQIKERDHYTCKACGVSTEQEPHLLLEIDHIVPVSKGGLTTEENLQTLCWRCNRSKGSKVTA